MNRGHRIAVGAIVDGVAVFATRDGLAWVTFAGEIAYCRLVGGF